TETGLAHLDGQRFVRDSIGGVSDVGVQFIAPAGRGLLVGTGGKLYLRVGETTTLVPGVLPDSTRTVDGAVDRDGTIWVGTRDGALRIKDGRVDKMGEANGLLTKLVNRVFIDREGDVWFGTESGASKHVPGPFRTYTADNGLPSPFVRAIQVDAKGRLWTGTRNGVAVRDGEIFRSIPLPGVKENRVYSLARDGTTGMLIGTRRGLLWITDTGTREYHEADGLPSEVVYCLVADPKGGVWIGTDRGLARWENGHVAVAGGPEAAKLAIISITLDSRGRLWMGRLAGGISILEADSLRAVGIAQGATDQTVWALGEDTHGSMWAATNGDGALRIDAKGIRHFTMADGLASNFVWQVLPDSHGDIWLFGNLGIDRLSGERLTHYGRGNGLVELEGSASASQEDADGTLWFGTGSGIVRYSPGLDVVPALPPPVFVEEATRDAIPFALSNSGDGEHLERGVVRIRFAAPSFRDESAIRFRYRLVGATDTWSPPTAERSITYAGLSPGRYQFEVQAVNGTVSSAAPARLAFTITPALWQTWWFRLAALLVLVSAVAAAPVLRARSLERERQRLEALVEQHTRDLADKNVRLEQSNRDLEHFAYVASHDLQEPLRKIQAFSDRITKQYSDKVDDQGRDYLSRMSGAAARMQRLIEDLLNLSRVTTKRNSIESIELRALAQEVLGDLEFRIQSTKGRVEIGDLPRIDGDPVQIRQIFQNLIGNALKFHKPDETPVVKVSAVRLDSGHIELRFEDNGIGFATKDAERVFLPFHRLHGRSEYEGTGIGLTICQKIAERHGGSIRAESIPGEGSSFVVTLPMQGPMGERHAA
ncbi:MAG TPA: two-component regulator propeller domain-containing protein, partial [Gemmatimonadaceae bacterium]|nr:two-component regulator propeller domain-containing protein [Gemmatimonadaceae bacterium]